MLAVPHCPGPGLAQLVQPYVIIFVLKKKAAYTAQARNKLCLMQSQEMRQADEMINIRFKYWLRRVGVKMQLGIDTKYQETKNSYLATLIPLVVLIITFWLILWLPWIGKLSRDVRIVFGKENRST
jgi:hypothetical protein